MDNCFIYFNTGLNTVFIRFKIAVICKFTYNYKFLYLFAKTTNYTMKDIIMVLIYNYMNQLFVKIIKYQMRDIELIKC